MTRKVFVSIFFFITILQPVRIVYAGPLNPVGLGSSVYTYDHSGNRIIEKSSGTTTYYPNKYSEIKGNVNTNYIYVGDTLVATVENNTQAGTTDIQYNHGDQVKSSTVTSNDQGVATQTLDYYPYGEVRLNNQTGTFNEHKQFGGHYADATGLNYLGARYYDSKRGQFISVDPEFWATSEEWLLDPQNQNVYSYARNNPINLMDPTGRSAVGNIISSIKSVWNNIWNRSTTSYQAPVANLPKVNQTHKVDAQKTATWDSVTDKRISQLDPRVQQPAINFINQTESNLGVQLRVTTGYRSSEEQNRLYMSSRTNPPGPWRTDAKAGQSYHNYGLAIDVVRMKEGQADWTPISSDVASIAKQQGFTWGGNWTGNKDYPHFEMTFGQHWSELMKTR